ncbi:class I SAM-dependent methyltransferase [Actinoplanes sp. NPDC024001]|uniref:class I SAM-dependent DNA methyltransferase n=1 Tax=Actinoplanes sp. NPDC024001 TaxID=3154598 RepID=UPI0034071B21
MTADAWMIDTRTSYDTVAKSYADLLRDSLDEAHYDWAMLSLFKNLVEDAGNGPVADVGCGTGRITAYLAGLGMDVLGIDLSPGMIDVARRDHPELRFSVGSMTSLDLPDDHVAGLLAWWSLIHVPDEAVPVALGEFRRVLRAGSPLVVGFFTGDQTRLKTEGYGGHPMRVHVYHRPPERVAGWIEDAGFTVEARLDQYNLQPFPGAVLIAR